MARSKGAKVMGSRISSLFGLGVLLGVASLGIAAEVPHVFQPGQVIESSKMNENFAFLAQSGGGKRAEYNIDCSSGTNLLTETIAGASAREIDITISGVCVEDHLKLDFHRGSHLRRRFSGARCRYPGNRFRGAELRGSGVGGVSNGISRCHRSRLTI